MAIPMQGSWTVSVKAKNAAFQQRFEVAGADSGNGTYTATASTPPVAVTGSNWRIQIQHDPGSGWVDSTERIKFPVEVGGSIQFDIESNDSGGDEDFDDLILMCSTPRTPTDFVVYGHVSSYSGFCLNPCWPRWIVIDSELALAQILRYPAIKKVIEKLYPKRVIKRPPLPDPPPFIPMVIPLDSDQLIPEKRAQIFKLSSPEAKGGRGAKAQESEAQIMSVRTARMSAASEMLAAEIDRRGMASVVDRLKLRCFTESMAGYPISFQEYDRTGSELTGGPYTGTGTREELGQTVTDINGNYVFKFSRSIGDFLGEADVDVAMGEDEIAQSAPDIIANVLDSTAPGGVAFQSAPYWNISNLRRINLCFPKPKRSGCQGGRNIQALGAIRLGIAATTFDSEGRITCTDTTLSDVPQARCAAWFGRIRVFGCFFDTPGVTQYTIRHRRIVGGVPTTGWEFYQEGMFLQKIGFLIPQQIGPFDRNLEVVNGGGLVPAKAYDNIEQNMAWAASDWFLKAVINTGGGTPAYAPQPGTVEFELQGYDAAGNFVNGATDNVTLYIDNTIPDLDLISVEMGSQTGGDCALFDLSGEPDPAVLTVRFRAIQEQGFLGSYTLYVRKGNIGGFPIAATTGPMGEASGALSQSYTHGGTSPCGELSGTQPPDEPLADASDAVTAYIIPSAGNWLAPDQTFCTFSVNISATMRRTNGYNSAEDSFGPDQYLLGIQQ